jgi:hypothetical protein
MRPAGILFKEKCTVAEFLDFLKNRLRISSMRQIVDAYQIAEKKDFDAGDALLFPKDFLDQESTGHTPHSLYSEVALLNELFGITYFFGRFGGGIVVVPNHTGSSSSPEKIGVEEIRGRSFRPLGQDLEDKQTPPAAKRTGVSIPAQAGCGTAYRKPAKTAFLFVGYTSMSRFR